MRICVLFVLFGLMQSRTAGSAVSVTSLGAQSNGTNPGATTAAFKTAFARFPKGYITVPKGTYLIDNSAGPLTISNFSGKLEFDRAAQLVFTTNTNGGLLFVGGSGAIITGLQATYATPPKVRNSPNEEIKFSGTANTVLMAAVSQNSPAAGILFYGSTNPTVTNATVINSLADGLSFSNCQNARVTNLVTLNTGDDGLSFLNFERYPNLTGGLAENIIITNSRTRGIAVVGQSNITVNGFQIRNTSSSGVLVDQDTYNNTRIPANVVIANGTIYNAGTLAPLVGNHYGVEYNSQQSVTFMNIAVIGSGNSGLSGIAPQGKVTVKNVTVDSPRSGNGFLFYQTQDVQVTGSVANNTPSYGFIFSRSARIVATDLMATNTSKTDPLKRAVWFEDAEMISASSINILSDAGMANVVGCHTNAGYSAASGSVKTINFKVNGPDPTRIDNSCQNVSFTP